MKDNKERKTFTLSYGVFVAIYAVLIVACTVTYLFSYYKFALVEGMIGTIVSSVVFTVVSIILAASVDEATHINPNETKITVTVCIAIQALIAIVQVIQTSVVLSDMKVATEPTVATVLNVVSDNRNLDIIVEFDDNNENKHRASISVSDRDALYVVGDKVEVRYAPGEYDIVYAEHLTAECPLSWFNSNKRNPKIIQ